MDSRSTPIQNPSAATTVPFDVLHEIFSYCLPDSPLDDSEAQPNTKIAPMSLCHVCSSWRIAALHCPYLWTYLYYRLPIHWKDGRPVAWDSKIFVRSMECLKWWRQNQGSKGPFIRFEYYQPEEGTGTQVQEYPLMHDDIHFFVGCLSSAQYLDVGRFALYALQQDCIYSSSQASCPNLRSLVTRYPNSNENEILPHLVPFYIVPTLRRLRVHHVQVPLEYTIAFAHWSGLTHISLHDMLMVPEVWLSLIRAVPNLRWGCFNVFLESLLYIYDPPKFTLQHLETLSVTVDNSDSNIEDEPFSLLLTNLHLPALRDLSIYIDADPWNLPGVAMRINDGLKSAPAITKLTLGFQFLGFTKSDNPLTEWEEVDKLTTIVPCLTHLVLDMCYMHPNYKYEATLSRRLRYWKIFLPPWRWLDLQNPASTLHKISVVVREPSKDGPLVEVAIRGALGFGLGFGLNKGEHDTKTKAVEIIPQDKMGLAPYAEGYKTWGCSL